MDEATLSATLSFVSQVREEYISLFQRSLKAGTLLELDVLTAADMLRLQTLEDDPCFPVASILQLQKVAQQDLLRKCGKPGVDVWTRKVDKQDEEGGFLASFKSWWGGEGTLFWGWVCVCDGFMCIGDVCV